MEKKAKYLINNNMILDNELITPTESYIFNALLDKVINQDDFTQMEIATKAKELQALINNS